MCHGHRFPGRRLQQSALVILAPLRLQLQRDAGQYRLPPPWPNKSVKADYRGVPRDDPNLRCGSRLPLALGPAGLLTIVLRQVFIIRCCSKLAFGSGALAASATHSASNKHRSSTVLADPNPQTLGASLKSSRMSSSTLSRSLFAAIGASHLRAVSVVASASCGPISVTTSLAQQIGQGGLPGSSSR